MVHAKFDTKKAIRELRKIHGGLAVVAASLLNDAGALIQGEYKRRLKNSFVLRNNFTLNAIKMFKAKERGRGGNLRKIRDINAIVFVPNIKGKQHYLADQEEAGKVKGTPMAKWFIPTPTKAARSGGTYSGKIKRPSDFRIMRRVQTLKIKGRKFGEEGDGFKSVKQRVAILHRTRREGNPYGWDLNKPFFFDGNIHRFAKNRFPLERILDERSRKLKKEPNFTRAVEKVGTPQKMEALFIREAMKRLG